MIDLFSADLQDKVNRLLFETLFPFAEKIILALAGVVIVYGGWLIATAAGDPDKFKQGRKMIVFPFVLLLLFFAAREIIRIIIEALYSYT